MLAPMCTGYPLFPGENEVEQLTCMMEMLGAPPSHLIHECSRRKQFFDEQVCSSPPDLTLPWALHALSLIHI